MNFEEIVNLKKRKISEFWKLWIWKNQNFEKCEFGKKLWIWENIVNLKKIRIFENLNMWIWKNVNFRGKFEFNEAFLVIFTIFVSNETILMFFIHCVTLIFISDFTCSKKYASILLKSLQYFILPDDGVSFVRSWLIGKFNRLHFLITLMSVCDWFVKLHHH